MPLELSREEIERIAEEKAARVMQDAGFQIREDARRARENAGDYARHFSREDVDRIANEMAEKTEERIVQRLLSAGLDISQPRELAKQFAFLERLQAGSGSAVKIFFTAVIGALALALMSVVPKMWK